MIKLNDHAPHIEMLIGHLLIKASRKTILASQCEHRKFRRADLGADLGTIAVNR